MLATLRGAAELRFRPRAYAGSHRHGGRARRPERVRRRPSQSPKPAIPRPSECDDADRLAEQHPAEERRHGRHQEEQAGPSRRTVPADQRQQQQRPDHPRHQREPAERRQRRRRRGDAQRARRTAPRTPWSPPRPPPARRSARSALRGRAADPAAVNRRRARRARSASTPVRTALGGRPSRSLRVTTTPSDPKQHAEPLATVEPVPAHGSTHHRDDERRGARDQCRGGRRHAVGEPAVERGELHRERHHAGHRGEGEVGQPGGPRSRAGRARSPPARRPRSRTATG